MCGPVSLELDRAAKNIGLTKEDFAVRKRYFVT